ncbi:hypothetical protein CCACVL1_02331 [Corchorus capsularis]|uniref:Uncharacterized protein n=1 Tax=Corchorus capsularis TaxID=210143 RepID=A0A1R3K976_COCAP|nr:hypothetical protein CCACVL1_02331 [Corchorus capsularis]
MVAGEEIVDGSGSTSPSRSCTFRFFFANFRCTNGIKRKSSKIRFR